MPESADLEQMNSGTDAETSANESGFAVQKLSIWFEHGPNGLTYICQPNGFKHLDYVKEHYAAYLEDNNIVAGPPLDLRKAPKEMPQDKFERICGLGVSSYLRSYTYIAQGRETNRIKIGMSVSPETRINDLRREQGEPIDLLVTLRGAAFEAFYLNAFQEHRIYGEWFAPHPDILAEIERLKGGAA
jgi:hypothetical protein